MPSQEWTLAMWDMDIKIRTVQVQMISDQKENKFKPNCPECLQKVQTSGQNNAGPQHSMGQRAISGPVLPATQLMDGRPRHAGHAILGFLRVSREAATTYQPIATTSK